VAQPPYALLADVDGPISNPDAKAIVDPRILPALTSLLEAGIPIVFNTGRSSEFVERNVFAPLLEQRPPNLHLLHGVCEKGAVWLSLDDDGTQWHFIDEEIAVPAKLQPLVRELVQSTYAGTMFVDETKETMITVERRADVDHDTYQAAQSRFLLDLDAVVSGAGVSVTRPGLHARNGEFEFQIDPSIIAVDLESVRVGKDLGAERAHELLRDSLPVQWRTIGDSAVDYAMADWLHAQNQNVAHIDVGPKREKQERPYQVLIASDGIHDDAGGAYVAWLAEHVRENSDAGEEATFG
jgi:hypothetical protein